MTDAEKFALYKKAFEFYWTWFVAYYNTTEPEGKTFCDEFCICSEECKSHGPNVWACTPKILAKFKEINQ